MTSINELRDQRSVLERRIVSLNDTIKVAEQRRSTIYCLKDAQIYHYKETQELRNEIELARKILREVKEKIKAAEGIEKGDGDTVLKESEAAEGIEKSKGDTVSKKTEGTVKWHPVTWRWVLEN